MPESMPRRAFVARAAAAAAAAALVPRLSSPQAVAQRAAPAAGFDAVDLADGLALIRGAGAHITVLETRDGLVLVDAGLPERTAALTDFLTERWPGRPVHTLFNTNWRDEHTGGNTALHAAGAESLAHENTRLWMAAEFEIEWAGRTHSRSARETWPKATFYEGGTRTVGEARLGYGHLERAHTDLLAVDAYPLVDWVTGGWIGGMADATKALLEIAGPGTRIVAASGPVQRRDALEAQLELCETVLASVRTCYRSGGSLEDFIASAPAAAFEDERGDPTEFLALVYEGAWGHARSLGAI
jgi:hypothetical protein